MPEVCLTIPLLAACMAPLSCIRKETSRTAAVGGMSTILVPQGSVEWVRDRPGLMPSRISRV
ncbi:hypothetical protein BD310DRAFT_922580 [Dichomitus squalens]|uniref:Uncharacterized protein n=1 Tax=Dichomitus squalens TaxID=114155 RepID=A0A4Q9Q1N3_9APHY|nr:hypothetical protein BD310DRAFT_922580 [Dichomitus squalens]